MTDRPLWTVEAMAAAMGAAPAGPLPLSIPGISIDTRTVAPGEAFFAIKGDNRDGHDFVEAALAAGAGLAVVAADRRDRFPDDAPLLVVPDVLDGLRDLARAARARAQAKIIAVTGSVGKTSTKEALRLALAADGETHASVASYNNHWGVPLSLARCPASARYAVFEIGMNHAGEIEPLTRLVRPQVAIITTVEPVHLEFFGSVEAIADAKAEIFLGLEPGGAAVINRDNPQFARLERGAQNAGVARIVSFGEHARADARLIRCALQSEGSTVEARIFGTDVTYKLGAPGRHLVLNSLAVLAASVLVGADLALAALALAELQPATRARRARHPRNVPGGTALADRRKLQCQSGLDARGAGACSARRDVGPRGRRIAVLGDMLELGPQRTRSPSRTRRSGAGERRRPRLLLRSADARACGRPFPPAAGGAMRRPRPRSNRRCLPPSSRATPSWSRDRSAPAWRPSSRRCKAAIAAWRRPRRAPRFRP